MPPCPTTWNVGSLSHSDPEELLELGKRSSLDGAARIAGGKRRARKEVEPYHHNC